MRFFEKLFTPKDASGKPFQPENPPEIDKKRAKEVADNFAKSMTAEELRQVVEELEQEQKNLNGEELIERQKRIHDLIKILHLKERGEDERRKEFGHNIYVEVDFDRHFQPHKDPETGASLDELAPKGHKQKRKAGKELSEYLEENDMQIKEYASEKLRAQQSAAEVNSLDEEQVTRIINQPLSAELKEKLVKQGYDKGKLDRRRFDYLIRIKQELNPLKWGAEFKKECLLNPDGSKRSYDEVVQYWLDHTDPTSETTSQREAAAALAYRLFTIERMTDKFYDDSDVLLKHKTHGPNPDALLREIMVRENGRVGFDDVKEIGGAIKPGETVKFIINVDEQGNKTIKLKFRDKVYDVDEDKIKELAEEYKKAKEEKKEKA